MWLWKSPPLVMQDWLVSLHWGLFLLISRVQNPQKNKLHYLLVRCAFSSWLRSDPIPTGDGRNLQQHRWDGKQKLQMFQCVTPSSLLMFSHFTWDSISSCWMRPGAKSVKTLKCYHKCHIDCDVILFLIKIWAFWEVTHVFQVNIYIYHHTNACTFMGQSKIYCVTKFVH